MYEQIRQIQQVMEIQIPPKLLQQMEQAMQGRIETVMDLMSEMKALSDHFVHLVKREMMNRDAAASVILHAESLSLRCAEILPLLRSILVMAEYTAVHTSIQRSVESKRKEAETWVQPIYAIVSVLEHYMQSLNRITYTLREVLRILN